MTRTAWTSRRTNTTTTIEVAGAMPVALRDHGARFEIAQGDRRWTVSSSFPFGQQHVVRGAGGDEVGRIRTPVWGPPVRIQLRGRGTYSLRPDGIGGATWSLADEAGATLATMRPARLGGDVEPGEDAPLLLALATIALSRRGLGVRLGS